MLSPIVSSFFSMRSPKLLALLAMFSFDSLILSVIVEVASFIALIAEDKVSLTVDAPDFIASLA